MKKALTIISQFILGLTFIISGVLKCIDPKGTSIKLHDYFGVFGLSWLNDFSLFLSWLLCLSELVIGLNILFGRNRRLFPLLALVYMCIFTPITLYLAIYNPISDCGCFGDAIVLSNTATFLKNVVLLACAVIIFIFRHNLYEPISHSFFTFLFYWELVVGFGLCYLGSAKLPLIDFRPYRPGVNITEAMNLASGNPAEPKYVIVYQKDGVTKEFDLNDIPDEDSGWEFVETKTIDEGNTDYDENKISAIKSFFVLDHNQEDYTYDFLDDENYSFCLISPDLSDADERFIDRIETIYEYSKENHYNFYCITLNDSTMVNDWKYRTGAEYTFLYSDATILETMIRSNPGIMLIKEGTILWKSCIPDIDIASLTSAKLTEQSYGETMSDNRKTKVFWMLFLMLAPLFLYLPIEKVISSKKIQDHLIKK